MRWPYISITFATFSVGATSHATPPFQIFINAPSAREWLQQHSHLQLRTSCSPFILCRWSTYYTLPRNFVHGSGVQWKHRWITHITILFLRFMTSVSPEGLSLCQANLPTTFGSVLEVLYARLRTTSSRNGGTVKRSRCPIPAPGSTYDGRTLLPMRVGTVSAHTSPASFPSATCADMIDGFSVGSQKRER